MQSIIRFIVPEEFDNKTLKEFLKSYCHISSRALSALKRENMGISRNSKLIRTIDTISTGDEIILKFPEDVNDIIPVQGDLDILFEDEYILVINKPSNMPVHPTKIHQLDTLANIVSFHMKNKNENYTFRCINRLDRDTSGIVVVAKNRFVSTIIQGTLKKEYYAICEGVVDKNGTIDKSIKVMEGRSIQRVCCDDGERAVTHYKFIKSVNNCSLVSINLETGRTHQIRCHFSYIGHPLCGDDMYGGLLEKINRQALHCKRISFIHPVYNREINIDSDLPQDMKRILLS